MMTQLESFTESWQFPNFTDSAFNEFELDFFPQFNYSFPTKFPADFDVDDDPLQIDCPIENFFVDFDEFESMDSSASPSPSLSSSSSKQIVSGDQWSPLSSPSLKSSESSVSALTPEINGFSLQVEGMEIDTQQSLLHLLKAYGEAMEGGQADLMEAISRRAAQKADPFGGPLERLVYYLFRQQGDGNYIRQESRAHSSSAYHAFYQAFSFSRFAHFAANSAILESAPASSAVRVVDFDLGEGVQWAPVIATMAARGRTAGLRLTAIKPGEDEAEGPSFADVSRRLCCYAREVGVELTVEEMTVDEVLGKAEKGTAREWTAFNCTVGWRQSRRHHVAKFLRIAEEIIAAAGNNGGIITYGDQGGAFGKMKSSARFGEFFEGCLWHYQTVLECMEEEMPREMSEARLAMEALFVSPWIDAAAWGREWEEGRGCLDDEGEEEIRRRVGGYYRVSRERLMEAKEMVGGGGRYEVGINGERENEMLLHWRGTPLVTFSAWGR